MPWEILTLDIPPPGYAGAYGIVLTKLNKAVIYV